MPLWGILALLVGGVICGGLLMYVFAFAAEKVATARMEFEASKLRRDEAEQNLRAATADADAAETQLGVAKQHLADMLRLDA